MTTTTAVSLAATDLHLSFGPNAVLRGVDLDVARGESMAIIGQSGSGKSVTLKCILGLIRPDSGAIRVDGEDMMAMGPRDLDRARTKFGMLFQGSALFDSLNVEDNVAFALRRLHRYPEHQIPAIVEEKLEAAGQFGAVRCFGVEQQHVDALRLRVRADPRVQVHGAALDDHHESILVGLLAAVKTSEEEQEATGDRKSTRLNSSHT